LSSKESDNLLNFVTSLAGDHFLKIEENLGDGFVRLKISEAERRQAKHDIRSVEDIVVELLRNSRDSGASKTFVSSHKEDQLRKIVVIDDGCGIPTNLHEKIFEPRVTSKLDTVVLDRYGVHGRGMALFSVKSAADKAWVVSSFPGKGSVFKIEANTAILGERKDQSTFPTIRWRQGEPQILRGPHNIVRILVEFNIDHPQMEIYLGSPAEILSTMLTLNKSHPNGNFSDVLEQTDLKLWRCIGCVSQAKILPEMAKKYFELEISERNAHRIMNREIKPLPRIFAEFGENLEHWLNGKEKEVSRSSGKENLSKFIQDEDLEILSQNIVKNFDEVGKKYFLKLQGKPKIQRGRNRIKIDLDLEREEEI